MSGYGIVYQSVMRNPKLSPEAKCIYVYLSTFADKRGVRYPSIKTLTAELGIGYKRLSRHMKQLQELGIIEKIQTRDKGSFGANTYRVTHGNVSPLGHFALTPDALSDNALTLDAITPKAITEKAITPNAPTNNTSNIKHYQEINNTINQMNNTSVEYYQNDNNIINDEHYQKLIDNPFRDDSSTEYSNILKARNARKLNRNKKPLSYTHILKMYNEICTTFPPVAKLSKGRISELNKRRKEGFTEDDFKHVFELAQAGKHLEMSGWKRKPEKMQSVNIDWLILKTVMERMLYEYPPERTQSPTIGKNAI